MGFCFFFWIFQISQAVTFVLYKQILGKDQDVIASSALENSPREEIPMEESALSSQC